MEFPPYSALGQINLGFGRGFAQFLGLFRVCPLEERC